MNLKVAHLVSVQFGIFIGIVSCLLFLHFEKAGPGAASEMREPATKRVAVVEPKSEPEDERDNVADYRDEVEPAESLAEQSIPAMPTEYSPEAVEKSMAILTKLYYEQIAPRRNASTVAANSSNAAVAPSYTEVAQEPDLVQPDEQPPPPQNVAYVQPTQVIVYPQPVQFISFSHPRRFVNRCRPAPHPGALASNSHRRPDRGATHLNGSREFESQASPSTALGRPPRSFGPGQHWTTGVPTCPSTERFTSRGRP